MIYPDYPNNRLIVNGTDLTETYGMILMDGYSLGPPSIKTYEVDIPGGNGKLDLTESLLGDTAYGNRKQQFNFSIIDASNFEQLKTDLSNFLHGHAFNYAITMDPDYTYHGRFTIASYQHTIAAVGIVGIISIDIDADPFKLKPMQVLMVNAVGGKICFFPSGRMRVSPTIQTSTNVRVIYDGKSNVLPSGSWTINDLTFNYGQNEVYLNSYPIHNLTWGDLTTNATTWTEFKTQRLFEWYKSEGDFTIETRPWSAIMPMTWGNLGVSKWADLVDIVGIPDDVEDVTVMYDWGDL